MRKLTYGVLGISLAVGICCFWLAWGGFCSNSYLRFSSAPYLSMQLEKRISPKLKLAKGEEVVARLEKWLGKKKFSMFISFSSFAPRMVIEAENLSVNFVGKNIVVSMRHSKGKNWKQFVMLSRDDEINSIESELRLLFKDKNNVSDDIKGDAAH